MIVQFNGAYQGNLFILPNYCMGTVEAKFMLTVIFSRVHKQKWYFISIMVSFELCS